MKKKIKAIPPQSYRFHFFLVALACLLTIALIVARALTYSGYDMQVGLPSTKKIVAEQKVENTVATERKRKEAQEAADKLEPITERDESIKEKIDSDIEIFFENADKLRVEWLLDSLTQTEETPDETPAQNPTATPAQKHYDFKIPLSNSMSELLLTMDSAALTAFKEKVYTAVDTTLEKGVREVDAKDLLSLQAEVAKLDLNADMQTLCYDIISAYLKPNIVVNEVETQAAREKRAQEYEVVYFQKNERIVDENQIVTEEIYAVLENLGLVKGAYKENIIPDIGFAGIIIIVFAILIAYFRLFYKSMSNLGRKEALLLFTLYSLTILLVFAFSSLPYFVLPILVATLLIAILIDGQLAVVLNTFLTIVCALIYNGDMQFMLFFLISGACIALLSTYTTERSKMILAGAFSSVLNFAISLLILLIFDRKYELSSLYFALSCGGMGIVSVIIAMGTLPIWEVTFSIITPIKLLDLANPNSPLLRRLTIEAPGTYHHSLIVANLSETAAYDIGANPNLARVGAYYHDIGKLKYPNYFSENQAGPNLHDDMDPRSSVHVIISHITYGIALAEEYRLPQYVKDIIVQHHGSTLIKFFYFKAKKQHPDAEIPEGDYRYVFPKPQTKEAAIVMLADTVEAAVRSKLNTVKDASEIEAFIRELVKDKQDDGQFSECPLTLKDIETIIYSFLRVFKGMYHERIPYPKEVLESQKQRNEDYKEYMSGSNAEANVE